MDSNFNSNYYDYCYYADPKGKKYRNSDGSTSHWGYLNPTGEWLGADNVALVWKNIFKLHKCRTDSGLCKVLDVGCGRGKFISALRTIGIEAWGFDYSSWAVQNQYPKCQKGWIVQHDATVTWPYGDNAFDLTLALDIMEHLFEPDIDFVVNEMYRVSKRWIFLQIATCRSYGRQGEEEFEGYILKREDKIPIELESTAVAGHVTVQPRQFWIDKLLKDKDGNERKWKVRDNMVLKFVNKTPNDVIDNWLKNTILILEKIG